MLARRTLLGAVLALPAIVFDRWLPGRTSGSSDRRVRVEDHEDGWRVIKYHESMTWFDIRFKLDGDYETDCQPPASDRWGTS